jgi:hypothetical protein
VDRRQLLRSCACAALGYAFLNSKAWGKGQAPLFREASGYFSMTVNGIAVVVSHAAGSYSYANIDVAGPVEVVITALEPGFWKNGVEVLPSRHGIRPAVEGDSIRFTMQHAEKLALSRPGDYYQGAPLMFLFGHASRSARPVDTDKTVRYYAPGAYHEDIHLGSHETVYLDEGAVVYGSLNFWDATDAHVCGRGVVIHEGREDPGTDEGWQHRPDWHGITGHGSKNISVKEITVIVRSRTWMIQLQGCKDVLFDNIKVIGGTAGNANQDGIDWLGCGDSIVRDCFFRCSDDIFAIYGNTGFYDSAVSIPGSDVANILIEGCVLSTSISNIMRVGWPRKVFNSRNVVMRDCDVVHAGQGGCVVPFALAEFWADPDGKGVHSDYVFEDIRMDSIYSVAQLLPSKNGSGSVQNIRFRNIRMPTPPLIGSVISGVCSGISFENIQFGDHRVDSLSSLGLGEAALSATVIQDLSPRADFQYGKGLLRPGQPVAFDARESAGNKPIRSYAWNFGDGTTGEGALATHIFQDVSGTRMDGSGRFQVQLAVTDEAGAHDVIVRPVVIGTALVAATKTGTRQQGLSCRRYTGARTSWAGLQQRGPDEIRSSGTIKELALSCKAPYTLWFDGYLKVPVSGGYTFYMMSRDGAYLQVGAAVLVNSNTVQPQVCNTVGNAVLQHSSTALLEAGLHPVSFGYKQDLGSEVFALYWQGPANRLEQIPMDRFFRGTR